jgi:tRNA1Val (adenine37-N6)-methyltransferase
MIYHPERLPELFTGAAGLKLAVTRLRSVHGTADAGARMVLVEMVKGRRGALKVLPPLVVYGPDGNYGAEVEGIMRGEAC